MKCFSFPGNPDILHMVNSCTVFFFFKTKLSHPRTLWFFPATHCPACDTLAPACFLEQTNLVSSLGPGPLIFLLATISPDLSTANVLIWVTAQRHCSEGPSWVTDSCVCPQIQSPSVLQHNVVSRADSGVRYPPLGPQLFIQFKLGLVSSSVKWECHCNL